ncbi:MAG: hypothetical protein GY922_02240 [Proteobacteria bacterium]|nr:hypothetical protein [Pseudomonadota bacterium]
MIQLRYVGVYKPDSLELQNYAPETWDADSLIHVYDDTSNTTEYEFVFIEELGDSHHERTGEFHVLVGNFSELYDTLEDAEIALIEQCQPQPITCPEWKFLSNFD